MSVSLAKGERVSLEKLATGLQKMTVGLGWNPSAAEGVQFDLDAMAFMLGANGKVRSDKDFIFYNQLTSVDGSVKHLGDNLTGEGDGDDEQIEVDLTKVPADVQKILFAVTIYQAKERNQNFGQVNDAFIRIVNNADNKEVAKFDLTEDSSTKNAVLFAELYRKDGEWKFTALGTPAEGGALQLAQSYGVNVG